jgi:hypothetical protein
MVATTVLIAVVLTIVILVVGGWTGGRPHLPGGRAEEAQRRREAPDVWHGDPRPDVVDRPAGADAEPMDSEDRPRD